MKFICIYKIVIITKEKRTYTFVEKNISYLKFRLLKKYGKYNYKKYYIIDMNESKYAIVNELTKDLS